MKKEKAKKDIDFLTKEKTQIILSYWEKNPDKWIQFNELRDEFVNKIFNTNIQDKKPLYNYDSQLSRDLKRLVDLGYLKNKKIPQDKGQPKSKYRLNKIIKKEIINEGFRFQNKKALDIFPSEKIIDFNIFRKNIYNENYCSNKVILYGLSNDFFKKNLLEEENLLIKKFNEIDSIFSKIVDKKNEIFKIECKEKTEHFLNNIKIDRIKSFLIDKNRSVFGILYNFIVFFRNEPIIDLSKSKDHFDLYFKYGISCYYSDISVIKNDEIKIINSIKNFMENLDDLSYGKLWCEGHFHKDYNLTRSDIYKIFEWIWQNRNFVYESYPSELALSIYYSRESNELIGNL